MITERARTITRILTPEAIDAARAGLTAIEAGLVPTNASREVLDAIGAIDRDGAITTIGRIVALYWRAIYGGPHTGGSSC